jgi:thymidylate kinase
MPDGRVRAMARVIAIEGIDGAGKSTLIDAPAAELPAPTVRLADDGLW